MEKIIFQIPPSGVYLLKFLLEGYDNMFFLSTLNRDTGTVRVLAARGARRDLGLIIRDFSLSMGVADISLPTSLNG